ncbi:MAG: 30S ribosome-binding factor RbfA [Firmicutes bacterium]|nr:30S ribosome-binding factor RbfA [Bacillota bacterium]MBR5926478.1 30S ribosome-binding factor RbfA [Bacillota bacterium]MBR6025339.1 30S ribosome-binding factor RbfA [Bacillota bacterium]
MGRSYRPKMLGGEIQKVLGDMLIRGDLKDPAFRDKMIGINSVDVSRDGSYATLYITALSFTPGKEYTEDEKKELLKAFEKSSGYIRGEIGKAVKVRHIPELIFKFDESYEYGMKMDRILDSLK